MILPERVLGKASVKRMSFGFRDRADLLRDVVAQGQRERVVHCDTALRCDEGHDRGAGEVVGSTDHRGFGHHGV